MLLLIKRVSGWLRSSLWLIPLVCSVLAFFLQRRMVALDITLNVPAELTFSEGTATQLLSAVMGAMISFLGIVFAFFVLVLQLATGQLSPRLLSYLYQDRFLKVTLGIIAATLVYAFFLMARVRAGFVPSISIGVAGLLVVAGIVAFLSFFSHVAKHIRPVAMATAITRRGLKTIRRLHPPLAGSTPAPEPVAEHEWPAGPSQAVRYTGRGRVLQGLDTAGLLAEARRAGCTFALCVAVGDFVRAGSLLARVYGAQAPLPDKVLHRRMVLGMERQLELDSAFAFRLLVDIASRALSPGINDPSTAVQMLDSIEELLHELAHRDLATGVLRDQSGQLRVLLPVPGWEDFLRLGISEIRHYGRGAPQVTRRLRALLEALARTVPPERRPAVEHELELLARSVAGTQELELAGEGDRQGFGPSRSVPAPPSLH